MLVDVFDYGSTCGALLFLSWTASLGYHARKYYKIDILYANARLRLTTDGG